MQYASGSSNNDKKLVQIPAKAGGLGKLLEPGGYQTWLCLGDHACGESASDSWFCWVYHEKEKFFTPWAPNAHLRLLKLKK